ncbi:kdo(2)-lipid A phosphoethanolamine 7''-transferase [Ideonella livida]|uniref:Kdo(2)-lipid A phosphoethanolamine 7''-transferase n=1 Tax=Ideonella livida TaxID=2707176 RepID=A0A7C9TJS6_9BURK|nr:kdo(2)-lipid A phosphoethanolamine 7''-transferase [Ideonella livida]NDY91382.1 kdo(2)-lipid A phosphoethanolamine 7''-transferase [Ideonella livida]
MLHRLLHRVIRPALALPPLHFWKAWLAATLWVGAVLNLPTWWERLHTLWWVTPGAWKLAGPLGELALTLGTTGLLLAFAHLCGRWGLRLVGVFLVMASAVAAYYMVRFKVVIGHGVLNAVFTTDHDLSAEIVDHWTALWVLCLGVLPSVWLWRHARQPGLLSGWRLPGWGRAALLVMLSSLLLLLLGQSTLSQARKALRGVTGPETNLIGVAAHSYLPSNWIAGTGMVVGSRVRQARDDARLVHPSRQHRYLPATPLDDTVVVLVIGETTRSDRLGLLGHTRDTTPHMRQAQHLAAFAGWSCDTATKLSLACMFVRPQGIQVGKPGQPDRILEDNVFSVYKHLGFSIELFAMQSEAGFYTKVRPDAFKLREVIAAQPENLDKRLDDRLLVPEVAQSLARHPAGKGPHLVVLHTKGSHAVYSQRYPSDFARWTPECKSSGDFCRVDELLNAFDNSVLFVDQVLHELRGTLAGRKALMVWVPDHGESIDENRHFHATPRHIAPPEQRRVPLVFWASPQWMADAELARRYARLQAHAARAANLPPDTATYGHHNLFATLLGCIGVDSPDGGIAPELNLCH